MAGTFVGHVWEVGCLESMLETRLGGIEGLYRDVFRKLIGGLGRYATTLENK